MCVPARNVCVCYGLWNPPTASLPNCISAPRVASWWKTQRISFHSSSCALVPVGVVNLATCVSSLRRRGWWKKPSPIFWIWTAIMSILHTAPLNISHTFENPAFSWSWQALVVTFVNTTAFFFHEGVWRHGIFVSRRTENKHDTRNPEIRFNSTSQMTTSTLLKCFQKSVPYASDV